MASAPSPSDLPAAPFYLAWILGVSAILALIFGVVAEFTHLVALALPLGLFVLLFAPGYGLGSLLFRGNSKLHWTANFAIVIGLSVLFNAALGLLLLAFSQGLPPAIFAIAAVTVDVVAYLVARLATTSMRATRAPTLLPAALSLPHYSRSQRTAAYVLIGAIAVVLAIIVYLGSVPPSSTGQVSLATTAPLLAGAPGAPIQVSIEVGNNASTQQFRLVVTSSEPGVSVGGEQVPWGSTLVLGENSTSQLNFSLNPRASTTFPVALEFSSSGTYNVAISLESASGNTLRTNAFSMTWS